MIIRILKSVWQELGRRLGWAPLPPQHWYERNGLGEWRWASEEFSGPACITRVGATRNAWWFHRAAMKKQRSEAWDELGKQWHAAAQTASSDQVNPQKGKENT